MKSLALSVGLLALMAATSCHAVVLFGKKKPLETNEGQLVVAPQQQDLQLTTVSQLTPEKRQLFEQWKQFKKANPGQQPSMGALIVAKPGPAPAPAPAPAPTPAPKSKPITKPVVSPFQPAAQSLPWKAPEQQVTPAQAPAPIPLPVAPVIPPSPFAAAKVAPPVSPQIPTEPELPPEAPMGGWPREERKFLKHDITNYRPNPKYFKPSQKPKPDRSKLPPKPTPPAPAEGLPASGGPADAHSCGPTCSHSHGQSFGHSNGLPLIDYKPKSVLQKLNPFTKAEDEEKKPPTADQVSAAYKALFVRSDRLSRSQVAKHVDTLNRWEGGGLEGKMEIPLDTLASWANINEANCDDPSHMKGMARMMHKITYDHEYKSLEKFLKEAIEEQQKVCDYAARAHDTFGEFMDMDDERAKMLQLWNHKVEHFGKRHSNYDDYLQNDIQLNEALEELMAEHGGPDQYQFGYKMVLALRHYCEQMMNMEGLLDMTKLNNKNWKKDKQLKEMHKFMGICRQTTEANYERALFGVPRYY